MKRHLVACLLLGFSAFAGANSSKPVNVSLVPDVAVFKRTQRIEGFTLSVWGENETRGIALGFVNGTPGNSAGLAFGLVNYADAFTGAQLGIANWSRKDFVGVQWGLVNYAAAAFTGFQWGAVNYAKRLKGFQLGLVNYAETVDSGLQIGLVNVIPANKTFFGEFPKAVAPLMILANWRFQ